MRMSVMVPSATRSMSDGFGLDQGQLFQAAKPGSKGVGISDGWSFSVVSRPTGICGR